MKNGLFFLNKLPLEIQEKVLFYHIKQGFPTGLDWILIKGKYASFSHWLTGVMIFAETNEGWEYWTDIASKYK